MARAGLQEPNPMDLTCKHFVLVAEASMTQHTGPGYATQQDLVEATCMLSRKQTVVGGKGGGGGGGGVTPQLH